MKKRNIGIILVVLFILSGITSSYVLNLYYDSIIDGSYFSVSLYSFLIMIVPIVIGQGVIMTIGYLLLTHHYTYEYGLKAINIVLIFIGSVVLLRIGYTLYTVLYGDIELFEKYFRNIYLYFGLFELGTLIILFVVSKISFFKFNKKITLLFWGLVLYRIIDIISMYLHENRYNNYQSMEEFYSALKKAAYISNGLLMPLGILLVALMGSMILEKHEPSSNTINTLSEDSNDVTQIIEKI